jgi:hypothetical protein
MDSSQALELSEGERRGSMRWWAGIVLGCVVLPAVSLAQETKSKETRALQERVKVLEERLDKLDRVEAIKEVAEYVCLGGEISTGLPPGGHCPDGSVPDERRTFRARPFSRRESLADKIDEAIAEAETKRVAIGGSARGLAQQVLNTTDDNRLFWTESLEVFFLSRLSVYSTFFADVEAINGIGSDEVVGSRSCLNTDAETLGGAEGVRLRELWLQLQLLKSRLNVVVGHVDLTSFFDRNAVANDETTKFLNTALVSNLISRQPPNGPGVAVRYEPGGNIGVGFGAQAPNDTASRPAEDAYLIAELDYQTHALFAREGNYRLWGRQGRVSDALDNSTWGVGASLDQQMTASATVFVRGGFGQVEGATEPEYAWSTGVEVLAPSRTLRKDGAGVAFSRQVDADGAESVGKGTTAMCSPINWRSRSTCSGCFPGPTPWPETRRQRRDSRIQGHDRFLTLVRGENHVDFTSGSDFRGRRVGDSGFLRSVGGRASSRGSGGV